MSKDFQWLPSGETALAAMLEAIASAQKSVRLEMYIFHPSAVANDFRDALTGARRRGACVQVLLDAFGSITLPGDFWNEFLAAGGEISWFNPLTSRHIAFRDHRKMLVCDEATAFVGGFNIAAEYQGDGVKTGWRDLGLKVKGYLAVELAHAFDEMFTRADHHHLPFTRWRRPAHHRRRLAESRLLLIGPGRNNPLKRALRQDLKTARNIQILCAYFIPTWTLRRALARRARAGATVQIILPAKSDVPLSHLAGQSFYSHLLRAGVEIYEYQPCVLHAKMFLIDKIAYAGSANLDYRSLNINYELALRLPDPELAAEGRKIFEHDLAFSTRIDPVAWRKNRTLWDRLLGRMARFAFREIDPFLTWFARSKKRAT